MMLTSAVRSVESFDLLGGTVTEADRTLAESVLAFKKDWIETPGKKADLIERLDELFKASLRCAITLPEQLASCMLELHNKAQTRSTQYGVQISPMNFLLEDNIYDPEAIVSKVMSSGAFKRKAKWLGRYQFLANGRFAFAGPLGYAIMTFDFPSRATDKTRIRWAERADEIDKQVRTRVQEKVALQLSKKFEVDMQFAQRLNQAGLGECYFGNTWMVSGLKGLVFRGLGRTLGKIILARRLR